MHAGQTLCDEPQSLDERYTFGQCIALAFVPDLFHFYLLDSRQIFWFRELFDSCDGVSAPGHKATHRNEEPVR
jgi:hypothetical protein